MARATPGMSLPAAVVRSPTARVTVAGVARDFDALTVTRELGSGLPGQVAGTDDMVAATASVDLAPLDTVSAGPSVPWRDPHRPLLGDPVTVDLGMDGEPVRTLTGRVDASHGVVSDHWRPVDVVDFTDRLRRRISLDPLVRRHPSPIDGTPMDMGLHPTWVTDRAARRCGFYATPPLRTEALVSAPMAGSAWPERGRLVQATGTGANFGGYPTYTSAPWGLVVRNINASWEPYLTPTRTGILTESSPLGVHFLVSALGSVGWARVELLWRDGRRLVVRVGVNTLTVDALDDPDMDIPNPDPSRRHRFDFPQPLTTLGEVEVSVWIEASGRVTMRVQSKANGTDWTSVGTAWTPTIIRSEPMQRVRTYSAGNGSDIGGIQVVQSPSTFDLHDWTRTALIETDPDSQLLAVPTIQDRDCLELLKEQASAELASMWIDEWGRFRYRSLARLLAEPVSRTITVDSTDDVPWDEAWESVAESVEVTWQRPVTRRGREHTATAWEGDGPTLSADGEVWEEIAHPDAGVDWIDVAPLQRMDGADGQIAAHTAAFNAGVGSWIAGTVENTAESTSIPARSQHFAASSLTRLDARSYRIRVVAGTLQGRQLVLRSEDDWPLRPSRRNQATPILRARVVVEWQDEVPLIGRPFGTPGTGTYTHDCGWWVQSETVVQRIADHLARYMAAPWPTIQGMGVPVNDGRQLGDAEQIDFLDGYPPVRYVVTGIEDTYTADGGRSQSITGKITRPEELIA